MLLKYKAQNVIIILSDSKTDGRKGGKKYGGNARYGNDRFAI